MTIKHYIFTVIAAYLLLLLATIPAKPVANLINKNSTITLHGISGTLWSGKAHALNINNKVRLSNTEWSFKIWKLLLGRIAVDIDTQYLSHSIKTEIGSSLLGKYFVSGLKAKLPASNMAQLANIPLMKISGSFLIDIEHAQWKNGDLPTAIGKIIWENATVTVTDSASLGNVEILLGESNMELLRAEINNQGGDIKISGVAELAPEANYTVSIKLSPTATANKNIRQSLGLFSEKQSTGEYLFTNSGSLDQIGLI